MPLTVDDLPPPEQDQSASLSVDDLPAPPGPTISASALRGAASGVSAGFDDELTGALGAAGRLAGYKNLGSWKPFDPDSHLQSTDTPLSRSEIMDAYRSNRDAVRADEQADLATNPKATIAGNLAGAFMSPVGKLAAGSVAADATKGQKLVQAMKTSAMQGAVYGAGSSNADLTQGDVGDAAWDTAKGAGLGAAVPPVIEGAIGAAKGAYGGAKWASGKLFHSMFGVTPENAGGYLSRRSEINSAPALVDIKNGIDGDVKTISEAVDSGKMDVQDAKAALLALRTQAANQITQAGYNAQRASEHANDMLQRATAGVMRPLKGMVAPTGIASDVVTAVGDLKKGISAKSDAAWDALADSDQQLPTKVIKGALTQAMNGLKVGGAEGGAVGSKSEAAIGSLQKLRDQLDNLPAKLSMPQAKQIVQNLDMDIGWTSGAGEYMDPASREKLGIRRAVDGYMKRNVDGYAEAMAPVAKDRDLLDQVAGAFGDVHRATSRLGSISTPKGALDRDVLAQLEQATGRQGAFTGPIDQYNRVQSLLKNPNAVDQLQQALPEYQAHQQAVLDRQMTQNPQWKQTQMQRAVSGSPELAGLTSAQGRLQQAQATYDPVRRLTPSSTESQIRSFGYPKGAPIENHQALDQQTGKNYMQQIKDRAVLDSFSKDTTQGSRKTLMGATLGGLVGWAIGGGTAGGISGAALGGQVGGLADKYGPAMGKKILDQMANLAEKPSIKTIRNMDLPPSVKQDIEREFNVYWLNRSASPRLSNVAQQGDQSRGPEKDQTNKKGNNQ
jgi:hypothetical protein